MYIYKLLLYLNENYSNSSGSKGGLRQKLSKFPKIDKIDVRIIGLLVTRCDNKQIANELGIPLSTVQRRTRKIIQRGLVTTNFMPNYRVLGLKKGMIHIYLTNGDMKHIAEEISKMEGIISVSIHLGNSDIVAEFFYSDSEELMDFIASIKKIEGVDRTVWSEEVYVTPIENWNVASIYNKLIKSVGGQT